MGYGRYERIDTEVAIERPTKARAVRMVKRMMVDVLEVE